MSSTGLSTLLGQELIQKELTFIPGARHRAQRAVGTRSLGVDWDGFLCLSRPLMMQTPLSVCSGGPVAAGVASGNKKCGGETSVICKTRHRLFALESSDVGQAPQRGLWVSSPQALFQVEEEMKASGVCGWSSGSMVPG